MACVSSVWAPRRRISCSESCDPGKRIVDAVTSCMVVCSWRKRLLRKHLSRQAHRLFQLLAVHDFRLYLTHNPGSYSQLAIEPRSPTCGDSHIVTSDSPSQ